MRKLTEVILIDIGKENGSSRKESRNYADHLGDPAFGRQVPSIARRILIKSLVINQPAQSRSLVTNTNSRFRKILFILLVF